MNARSLWLRRTAMPVALACGLGLTLVATGSIALLNRHADQPGARPPNTPHALVFASDPRPTEREPGELFNNDHAPLRAETQLDTTRAEPAASLLPSLAASLTGTELALNLPGLRGAFDEPVGRGGGSAMEAKPPPETSAPRPTYRPKPRYPRQAEQHRISGFAVVRLVVDGHGRVTHAKIIASEPPEMFDEVALEAARAYRFEPHPDAGSGAPRTVDQRIVFRLPGAP